MKIYFIAFLWLYGISLGAFDYVITPSELNENVSRKFPIEKKFIFTKFLFSNPKLEIDKQTNMINFICDVKNPSVFVEGKNPTFQVFGSSDIKYDGQSIYLKEVKIHHIQNKFLTPTMELKLIKATELLLSIYFSQKPIFKITEAGYALKTANSFISDVVIEDGNIKVLLLE